MEGRTPTKIAVVGGAGAVGASAAYALMMSGLVSEIVLVDVNERRAEGEAMDLMHGAPFVRPVTVRAGTYDDCAGCQIVVITAGAAQKPGESRLDLVRKNTGIIRDMVPQIARVAPNSILLIVANPVDILTLAALEASGFPPGRVIGSGTVLDTARLRALVGQRLNIDPRSVHGYVIGEHGDSEVVVWSRATVAGLPVAEFCAQRGSDCDSQMQGQISEQVRRAAYEIIERKGATYYAIGLGVRHIVEAILRDQNTVLTVSTLMTGQFGISDICLSLPSIVDHGGVEGVLMPKLSDEEVAALRRSADVLKETARAVGL
ncbi:MAG: L-lactate dehydrogenase [Anaerolineae bacterium]|nr:L-lactate dehydrogenase [Anaerolineae bacterium]